MKIDLHVMAAVPEYCSILYAKAIKNINSNIKQLSLNINKESQRDFHSLFFNRDTTDGHSAVLIAAMKFEAKGRGRGGVKFPGNKKTN